MARGKKTPEETKAKVIEIKLLNLELSSYDIAKQLEWTEYEVSADTIQDIIKELPQVTANSISGAKQIERLDSIIWGIEAITSKLVTKLQLQEEISVNDVKQLNEISKTNWERKRLLQWDSTANDKITIEWQV